jgi:biotin carboxyl carrier protein
VRTDATLSPENLTVNRLTTRASQTIDKLPVAGLPFRGRRAKRTRRRVVMRTTLKMPKLGDAVDAAVIVELRVKPGDAVAEGQTIFVAETDKTQVEVPSPFAGTVVEIKVAVGEEVSTGSPTLTIEA